MKIDETNDYYIYQYDTLSERVSEVYTEYIRTPKRDGMPRKDVDFRWFDFKYFTNEDQKRLNNWDILGFSEMPLASPALIDPSN
jgi:hypothetical protein